MTQTNEVSKYTKGEELANGLSHFAGFLLGILALVLMLRRSMDHGSSIEVVTSLVFGLSMVVLYISSSLTHLLPQGKFKNIFFTVDRIAIYMLIAGTYTPITLVAIGGWLGWTMLGIEWGFALIGTFLILNKPVRFEKGVNFFFIVSYAVMGWLILVALVPLINTIPRMGWLLILIGGVIYSIGIFFYAKGKFRYHHLVWHILVLLGTLAHFIAIYKYILQSNSVL